MNGDRVIIAAWIMLIMLVLLILGDASRSIISGAAVGEFNALTDEQDARAALERASEDIKEMVQLGLNTAFADDLYAAAVRAFEGANITQLERRALFLADTSPEQAASLLAILEDAKSEGKKIDNNYTTSLELSERIHQHKERNFQLLDELDTLALDIDNVAITDPSSAVALLESARQEFQDGRLDDTLRLIQETYAQLEEERVESSKQRAILKSSQRTIRKYVRSHILGILIFMTIGLLASVVSINEIFIRSLNKKIQYSNTEKKILRNLMKRAQAEYYESKKIPKSMFQIKIDTYRDRLTKIKRETPFLRENLNKALKRRRLYKWPNQLHRKPFAQDKR